MMDSTDTKITYTEVQKRAARDAQDRAPDMPKENTVEAWEAFMADVEEMDIGEISFECAEWDWVIYYHRAMELCLSVPTSVLCQSEAEYYDCGGHELERDSFGLYEIASRVAFYIVSSEIAEAVDTLKDELIDLAQTQLDNMTGELI
jgi:hypothetical protein